MSHLSANDHLCHVTDISEDTGSGDVVRYSGEETDLSNFFDSEVGYHCGTSLEAIGGNSYKFHDNSVRPRRFLGTDDEDGINAILLDHESHSLHEIIDGDEPLHPIIDFDLPKESLVAIEPKLTPNGVANILIQVFSETCKEVFPEWDENTLTVASSTDAKKLSLHVSTYGLRVKNISQASVFTELVCKKLPEGLQDKTIIDNIANKRSFSLRILGSPKYIKETKEHVRKKKALLPKNGTVYDFMLRPSNDESKVIESPLLNVPEPEVKLRNDTDNKTRVAETTGQAEFDFIKSLLRDTCIEGYALSFPSDNTPNLFPLTRNSPSHCPLCDREHSSENADRKSVV